MKISIIHNKQEAPEKSDFIEVHYTELEQVDNSILTNIKIIDTLDYIDNPEGLILETVTKMRYGCKLTISAIDVLCIADKILCGDSNIDEIRKTLYNGKKSISHFEHIQRFLEQQGLKIELINLDKHSNKYLIVARKPYVE